jgi:PAS domain S-box-containing protein
MTEPLRLLLVEDSEDDAQLLVRRLKIEGFAPEWERVEDASGFRAALDRGGWDLILADYALPRFSGLDALKIFSAAGLEIPFIIVSGTIGEEIAIAALKAGAADYIMKYRLARLAPSIRRAIDDARNRREKLRMDEALKESVRRWSATFDSITDSICLLDADGRMLQCNEAHARYLNKSVENVIGKKCYALVHGSDDFFEHCPFQRMLKSHAHEEEEIASGDTWLNVAVDPILDVEGRITGAVHIMSDITPRKKAEEAVKASLAEKEVLLREIHHRVKNNMQVMISLLNLQAQAYPDAAVAALLKESQNRIRTMAIVHEKLYRSADLSHIDFSDYVESLSVHLFQFFAADPAQIRLRRETEAVPLDINNAIPCGLILNELISNALKYAFPDGREGEITVGFRRRPDARLELFVRDNGVGLPAGLDIRRAPTLGLQLVNLLTGQLDGTLELNRERGTELRVVFTELKYKLRV